MTPQLKDQDLDNIKLEDWHLVKFRALFVDLLENNALFLDLATGDYKQILIMEREELSRCIDIINQRLGEMPNLP